MIWRRRQRSSVVTQLPPSSHPHTSSDFECILHCIDAAERNSRTCRRRLQNLTPPSVAGTTMSLPLPLRQRTASTSSQIPLSVPSPSPPPPSIPSASPLLNSSLPLLPLPLLLVLLMALLIQNNPPQTTSSHASPPPLKIRLQAHPLALPRHQNPCCRLLRLSPLPPIPPMLGLSLVV